MGLPKVYAWGVLWYSVQLVIVGLLYTKVWVADDPVAASAKTPGESSPATENQD
jgi:hypothetical protein